VRRVFDARDAEKLCYFLGGVVTPLSFATLLATACTIRYVSIVAGSDLCRLFTPFYTFENRKRRSMIDSMIVKDLHHYVRQNQLIVRSGAP
jgi:predicted permease